MGESRGGRVRRWAVQLVLLVVFAEVFARIATNVPAVQERTFHRMGPYSAELSWYFLGYGQGLMSGADVHPRLGWIPREGVREERDLPVTTTAQGLREDGPVAAEAAPGVTRVLAVGDSFTFGTEAADGTEWPMVLERSLDDVEVVNHGVFGYGVDQIHLRWRDEGRALKPDVVVWGLVGHDLLRTTMHFLAYHKPMVRAEEGAFEPVGVPVPTRSEAWWRVMLTPRLLYLWRMATWAPETPLSIRRSEALLRRWAEEVREDGAVPVLAWFPAGWNLADLARDDVTLFEGMQRAWWVDHCESLDVVCVDTVPAFRERVRAGEDLTFGAHWTAEGHALVAGVLREALLSEGLLPAPPAEPAEETTP